MVLLCADARDIKEKEEYALYLIYLQDANKHFNIILAQLKSKEKESQEKLSKTSKVNFSFLFVVVFFFCFSRSHGNCGLN